MKRALDSRLRGNDELKRQMDDVGPELSPGDKIRIWMIGAKLKPSQMAREMGLTPAIMTHFLNGKTASKTVIAYLARKGCPEELITGDWIGAARRAGPRGKPKTGRPVGRRRRS
jgi:hypothetical protein